MSPRNPIDLTGKTAIVTAGAAGIGRVIVERYVAAGAEVSTCDVDEAALADLRAALPGVVAVTADVGRSADVGRLFDAHLAAFGAWTSSSTTPACPARPSPSTRSPTRSGITRWP